MEQYTFEAILFLAILANYHKSDAAKLNPYLKRIRETTDTDFMGKLCWASNFALGTSIKYGLSYFYVKYTIERLSRAYQSNSDTAMPPTLSFGSMITRLRPDRALALIPMSIPRDKFKDL